MCISRKYPNLRHDRGPKTLYRPTPILLRHFFAYYKMMRSDDCKSTFSSQYQDLLLLTKIDSGEALKRDRSCSAFGWPQLEATQHGINASYISSPDLKDAASQHGKIKPDYIAATGPLNQEECAAFWHLIWHKKCRFIVMLAPVRCSDVDRFACDQYWPTSPGVMQEYGGIQVLLIFENDYGDWSYRELRAKRGNQLRIIRQFQFKAWPIGNGLPRSTVSLLNFIDYFREFCPAPETHPILVHASRDERRSATFMALDLIVQAMEQKDGIDIFGICLDLARQREGLLPNEDQYIFIHKCIRDKLLNMVDSKPKKNKKRGGPIEFPNPTFGSDLP